MLGNEIQFIENTIYKNLVTSHGGNKTTAKKRSIYCFSDKNSVLLKVNKKMNRFLPVLSILKKI